MDDMEQDRQPTHNYNLRDHPTKRKQQVSLMFAEGGDITHHRSGGRRKEIHNNQPKSACPCNVNPNEYLVGAISFW